MKYKTIIIDPPYPNGMTGLRNSRPNQTKEMPYKVMTLEEIKKFDINKHADEDCLIFLWTTDKFLEFAHQLLKEWKFKKHCTFVWNKSYGICPFSVMFTNEFCLLGYRGKFKLNKIGIKTEIHEKPREHSRKPNKIYEIAEQLGNSPRIDIFSREKRNGWEQYGDELNKFKDEGSNPPLATHIPNNALRSVY